MKIKVIFLTILAIMTMLIPMSGVLADTVWSASASLVNEQSIVVTVTGGDGQFTPTADGRGGAWVVSTVGGGTLYLILDVKNNSSANTYTITATSIVITPGDQGVTATWDYPSFDRAPEQNGPLTLTVIVPPGANIGTYSFSMDLSKAPKT